MSCLLRERASVMIEHCSEKMDKKSPAGTKHASPEFKRNAKNASLVSLATAAESAESAG